MVSTVVLAFLIKQSTQIWNLSSETITLHVVSFRFVFKDVNNGNVFCKSVVVAVISKK